MVSIVIPCYNPTRFLEEAIASVRAQTYPNIEIILVNDGTDNPESLKLLKNAAAGAHRFIEQPNRGLAAARNAGFAAAAGEYVVPLDADDRLAPTFAAECVRAIEERPGAAFVYTDYRVFGDVRYIERAPEYNLYRLLSHNIMIYASLIRRSDWEAAGGYDDSMRLGYEDWDFWLQLAERGRFGHHVPRVLFEYRKHGRSLLTMAREHHGELVAKIHASHPSLYSWEGEARVKARWSPAVCVLGPELAAPQTIQDWERIPTADRRLALEQSNAPAFLIPNLRGTADSHTAELCALAVWGGMESAKLPDGSLALSRRALLQDPRPPLGLPPGIERINRHLVNAELDLRHPLRSAVRLIPLRVKERVNRVAGRAVFDLSFYLKFQPRSVLTGEMLVEPLRYMPRPAQGRRRIALITPHFGPGGAESVLLEMAYAIDRRDYEVFTIATQSQNSRWRERWEQLADHVYDVAPLVRPERMIAALYSIAFNWQFDMLVIQNSLAAYSAIPRLRRDLPRLKIVDVIHAVDEKWDFVSATMAVAPEIDVRVAISEAGARKLRAAGVPGEKIRLIRNGIDLERFRPTAGESKNILFAGRLDPVKRPRFLVSIASHLALRRKGLDFCFMVAGDGPEEAALRRRIRAASLESAFRLLGHVEDMPATLGKAAIVVVPSKAEGIPLIVLEAFAMERPVVCSRVGAAAEVVDQTSGVLIDAGPGEAERFAEALDRLLNDPQQRHEMGRAGRLKVQAEYNSEQAEQAYRTLFA